MVTSVNPQRQRHLIRVAQLKGRLSTDELWLRYFALGGAASLVEVDAFLDGALDLPVDQRDRLALAVNEHLDSLVGQHRAPYSRAFRHVEPETGPLAALTSLLRETHLAPPDAVPVATDSAAALLGVRTVIYLSDYAQETLVPMPGAHGQGRPPLGIDATLPGRAFRLLETQTTISDDGQPRFWMPILDGAERIGVLDVMVEDPEDRSDPVLHRQCWWLTHYLGHLLTALDASGDALDHLRRTQPRSIQAELIWQLLPPLTGGTDKVVVTGRIEPSSDVGGDVFDYALSSSTAHVAVMDATGHDLRAGLAAATALSTYRNARRQGTGLFGEAEAISRALGDQFGGEKYATAVLAELDLDSGRLRYLAAGHPQPLLIRRGKVVKSLDGGRRPMLGREAKEFALGEEQLQPEDTVVIYTDGITEARRRGSIQFGVERLIDTLDRAAADEMPLPEVARRVVKAILDHQQGRLQDDATLLLLRWTTHGATALAPSSLR